MNTPDPAGIDQHCHAINRTIQRGGRMLSVVDLVEARTLDRDLAAYLLAAIEQRCSFMVGALPGGAGKTTVMGALLNLLPSRVPLIAADGLDTIEHGLSTPEPTGCYICHEIGAGAYYAYLWDEPLRQYFRLPDAGHMLATNLHADTLDQARRQVCNDNAVPVEQFDAIGLKLFLHVQRRGGWAERRINRAYQVDDAGEHQCIFDMNRGMTADETCLVTAGLFDQARQRIEQLLRSGARTIEQVRKTLDDQLADSAADSRPSRS